MKDFLEQLDERLTALAAEHPGPQPARASPATAPRRRRRPALVAGIGALCAAVASALVLSAPSSAELPILRAPASDASAVRAAVPAAVQAGVDFTKAHGFDTPGGRGYALVTPTRDTLCIVIPDPGAPGSYGTSCGSLRTARARGTTTQLIGDTADDPKAVNTVAFVLPEHATDVRLRVGSREVTPRIESGIVVAELRGTAVLRWTVDGTPGQRAFRGPWTAPGGVQLDCGAGRVVSISAAELGRISGGPGAIRELRRQRC